MAIEAVAHGAQRIFGFRQDVAAELSKRLLATDPKQQADILAKIEARFGREGRDALVQSIDELARRVGIGATRAAPLEQRP